MSSLERINLLIPTTIAQQMTYFQNVVAANRHHGGGVMFTGAHAPASLSFRMELLRPSAHDCRSRVVLVIGQKEANLRFYELFPNFGYGVRGRAWA